MVAYEALCPDEELLSHQCDRWLSSENKLVRYGTYFAIGSTALHLLNIYDHTVPQADPYGLLMRIVRRGSGVAEPEG